jgi:hypothetical protein
MSSSSDAAMVSIVAENGDGNGEMQEKRPAVKNYKGFVAGVFSGVAKLTGIASLFPRLTIQMASPMTR